MTNKTDQNYEKLFLLEREYLESIVYDGPTVEKFEKFRIDVYDIDIRALLTRTPATEKQLTLILECLRHLDELFWVTADDPDDWDQDYWFDLLALAMKQVGAMTPTLTQLELLSEILLQMADNPKGGPHEFAHADLLRFLKFHSTREDF